MSKSIAVTSGKGGTGKSTISVGLAFAFASLGKKVLLIDMDEGLRCLDLMLGIDVQLVFDLSDALSGRNWHDCIYAVPGSENLYLIPAPAKFGSIETDSFKELMSKVIPEYDIIILDFPAGIDFKLYSSLPLDTQFAVVCSPDPVSVRDAAVVCDNLPLLSTEPLLILNKFVLETMRGGIYQNIDEIIDTSGFRLIGIVPENEELHLLPIYHTLKKRRSPHRALVRIAKRLAGEYVPLPKFYKI